MKMTDESALLAQARAVLARYADDDAQTVVNRIDARLAADQQKGGGVVVIEETTDRYGEHFTHVNAKLRVYDGYAPRVGDKLYPSPQPSIPAPAQQGDQLDAARWRKLEELVDTGSDRYWYVHPSDGEGGSYDRMKSASHLRQCIDRELAHPPHADQEPQG